METFVLEAQKRDILGKETKQLREKGLLPAVVYGPKTESLPLQISVRNFREIYKKAGDSSIIDLKIKDGEKEDIKQVLVKDVTFHHLNSSPLHVDFYEIERGKTLTTNVPLVFEGEAPGVKKGGILVKSMDELEIEALPKDLPREIKVDISSLTDFDQTIYVKGIKLPSGVKSLVDPETPVITLSTPISEEELEEELGKGKEVEEVEVEAEKKKKEETEEKSEESSASEPKPEEKKDNQ